jgi:hypothetical protein
LTAGFGDVSQQAKSVVIKLTRQQGVVLRIQRYKIRGSFRGAAGTKSSEGKQVVGEIREDVGANVE